jgi:excisionase family DNA binding protein
MSTAPLRLPPLPDAEDVMVANTALQQLKGVLASDRSDPITLPVEDGGSLVVPREAAELLARILAHMAAGEGVTVIPSHAELTTQQAAEILNVSRPYLIKLLECGAIEYRLVGKHRRVTLASLLAYKREDDRKRRQAADELSSLTQEMGLV